MEVERIFEVAALTWFGKVSVTVIWKHQLPKSHLSQIQHLLLVFNSWCCLSSRSSDCILGISYCLTRQLSKRLIWTNVERFPLSAPFVAGEQSLWMNSNTAGVRLVSKSKKRPPNWFVKFGSLRMMQVLLWNENIIPRYLEAHRDQSTTLGLWARNQGSPPRPSRASGLQDTSIPICYHSHITMVELK